jgi:hypothetical protein
LFFIFFSVTFIVFPAFSSTQEEKTILFGQWLFLLFFFFSPSTFILKNRAFRLQRSKTAASSSTDTLLLFKSILKIYVYILGVHFMLVIMLVIYIREGKRQPHQSIFYKKKKK